MNARLAISVLLTSVAFFAPDRVSAQAVAERALDIVREMDRVSRGYRDFEARLEMSIHRSGDPILIRSMQVSGLEAQHGDRTMIVLEAPADLAGTTFLSVQGRDGRRAQWMYLPRTGRVRRISGSRASDRFFGSHFTYADLAPATVQGFEYRWVRDEDIEGDPGVVIERTRSSGSGDAVRQLLWIDTRRHLLHRVDFLNDTGVTRRRLLISDYMEIDGFSRAARMEMVEVDSGEKTVLEWTSIRLGVGLTERDFDSARLGR